MTYLDHASATPPHPAAMEALRDPLWADPTRLYEEARRSRMALDSARAACARSLQARPEEITFTSGGTEAIALAVTAAARAAEAARRPSRILVSAIEQRSVLETARSLSAFETVEIPVDELGMVDLGALERELAQGAALVAIQVANGEIGTRQPLEQVASATKEARAWLLADASYAAGWTPLDLSSLGADLVTVSGGRCGGLPGTGLLWSRSSVRLRPMLLGDDRERGARAGIPNLPGVMALGAGLDARTGEIPELEPRLRELTARLRSALPEVLDEVLVHGHATERLPHIVSFSVPMIEGEALLLGLDQHGFAVHSGSACSSSTGEPSHVLAAIGTLTHGALRVSVGPETSDADIDRFLEVLPGLVAGARATLGRR